ncbi:hypothetical protein EMCRGX_G026227 [Ephydatia muelleri]
MAGAPEPLFLTQPSDFLLCNICLHVLHDPYQTPCGHRCCPVDRRPIDSSTVYPDNAAKLEINCLKVKCPNERNSCDWVGELSDAEAHIERCGFACVGCPQCGMALKRSALAAHESQCPKRLVSCTYCNVDYPNDLADAHTRDCTHFPEPCPNHCREQTFPRCDLKAHIEGECPLQEVICELSVMGCCESVKRSSVREHLITCSSERAGALAKRVVQQEAEIVRLNKELVAQAKEIQLLHASTYPCSGQFTWCVSNIRQKVRAAREGDPNCSVIYSPEFLSCEGGYLLQLCIYPTGDKTPDYMSLYFVVMKGPFDDVVPWPFQQRVILTLLSCNAGAPGGTSAGNIVKDILPDPRLHYFSRPRDVRNVGYGYHKFIPTTRLEMDNSEYVGSGCIYLRAVVM